MTRLTLRQHRTQLLAALALLTVIALILIWTRDQMTTYLDTSGLSGCMARAGGCDAINRLFQDRYGTLLNNIAYSTSCRC